MSNGAGIFLTVVVILIVISGFGYMVREDAVDATAIQAEIAKSDDLSVSLAEHQGNEQSLARENEILKNEKDALVKTNADLNQSLALSNNERDAYKIAYEEQYRLAIKPPVETNEGVVQEPENPAFIPVTGSQPFPTMLIVVAGIILIVALSIWGITRPHGQRVYAQQTAWQPQMKLQQSGVQVLISATELAWLVEMRSGNPDPAVHWKPVKCSGRSYMQVQVSTTEREQLVNRRRMNTNV